MYDSTETDIVTKRDDIVVVGVWNRSRKSKKPRKEVKMEESQLSELRD